MEIRQGYWHEQQPIDTLQLEQELVGDLRIFIDTIDEVEEVKHFTEDEYEYLIIRIPRSAYNSQKDKYEFIKQRIQEELLRLRIAA
jgi:hypothetical protein